jgi:AcrR family transcriptional regulator
MRRKTDQTRRQILDAAYESFWRAGFARTNIDTIAARAKLTKRTIYAYFRSKDDLLAAVLNRYSELAAQRLQRIGDRMPDDREGMIDSLFGQLAGWAGATPRWSGSGFTRLVVELADLPGHPARAIARRQKAATEAWLSARFARAGVSLPPERARDVMTLMEGAMSLTLIHGDKRYIVAAAEAAKALTHDANPKASARRRTRSGN